MFFGILVFTLPQLKPVDRPDLLGAASLLLRDDRVWHGSLTAKQVSGMRALEAQGYCSYELGSGQPGELGSHWRCSPRPEVMRRLYDFAEGEARRLGVHFEPFPREALGKEFAPKRAPH